MRFWDASALIPLCVDQPESATVRALLRHDRDIAIWWGSVAECGSVFARLRREGVFSLYEEQAACGVLRLLQRAWLEILPGDDVRTRAGRLLRLHPLGTADALQLAAASVWAGDPPSGEIVVFDQRLRTAAESEGLTARP